MTQQLDHWNECPGCKTAYTVTTRNHSKSDNPNNILQQPTTSEIVQSGISFWWCKQETTPNTCKKCDNLHNNNCNTAATCRVVHNHFRMYNLLSHAGRETIFTKRMQIYTTICHGQNGSHACWQKTMLPQTLYQMELFHFLLWFEVGCRFVA